MHAVRHVSDEMSHAVRHVSDDAEEQATLAIKLVQPINDDTVPAKHRRTIYPKEFANRLD